MSFDLIAAWLMVACLVVMLTYALVVLIHADAAELAEWRKGPVYETARQHHQFHAGQLVLAFIVFACLVPVLMYLGAACIALPLTWR